ncbi:uncharacterized protein si:ch211-40k21.5 [Notolabrus celidotus]|uniref:uncharacterized protein si:ch211-40k21.5 n=1 Tax=Notolabrus celidotus TaxID=1203425 RepID=UPI00148F9A69|nr:uncharacterized protein si:ch211-40k21.5 [Notolabrus celidotus]XP_034536034.1 uncharacterized protein si:ch211-40k21.5 [Notolabrus celidotus]XP_034536035.1 uncharacterized protein si:ch211-40k21.5 [Notolabrus celidotus]
MEDQERPKVLPLLLLANTNKKAKKRKCVYEKAQIRKRVDFERGKTRVNIGDAFARWRQLKESKGLKSDAMVAEFLLKSYKKLASTSTTFKHEEESHYPPAVSPNSSEFSSDRLLDEKPPEWSLCTIKVEQDCSYISDPQSTILQRTLSETEEDPKIKNEEAT